MLRPKRIASTVSWGAAGCAWLWHHSSSCSCVLLQGSNHCFISNCTPDCAWLQCNFGERAFRQAPIILPSGCALTDSHYFSLPLEYFKWLLKQETVFFQYDPWPLPDYARVRNCQASGRTPILFYFWTNQCKGPQSKLSRRLESNQWKCCGM